MIGSRACLIVAVTALGFAGPPPLFAEPATKPTVKLEPPKPGAKKPKIERRRARGYISRAACARLAVAHVPDADVTYRPGRDVYGRRVAPADLQGERRITMPRGYVIELELDLRTFLGLPTPPGLNPNLKPGTITVIGDKVYFNGQRLDDPNRLRIIRACRRKLRYRAR